MSTNKRYYFLKLKENFFDSPEIKILEAEDNGYAYEVLYFKLLLLSLKYEGKLQLRNALPYDERTLAILCNMNIDIVNAGISKLIQLGLVTKMESGELWMSEIQTLIGESSTEADRVRRYRERINKEKKNVQIQGPVSEKDNYTDVQVYKKRTKSVHDVTEMYENRTPDIRDKSIDIRDKSIDNKDNIYVTNSSQDMTLIEANKELTLKQQQEKELKEQSLMLANYLYANIMQYVNPPTYKNKKPNINNWAKDIEKMLKIDNIKYYDIQRVIDYVVRHDFWGINILSGAKLRKHYNRIYLEMTRLKTRAVNTEKRQYTTEELPELYRRTKEELAQWDEEDRQRKNIYQEVLK